MHYRVNTCAKSFIYTKEGSNYMISPVRTLQVIAPAAKKRSFGFKKKLFDLHDLSHLMEKCLKLMHSIF